MNKEFIPYEQALELKQLGFDEECLAYYELDNFNLKPIPMKDEINSFRSNSNALMIASPLYQQAFRWFREKYDLHHCVMKMHDYFFDKTLEIHEETYEEAELACLKKLIEIVKNK